MHRKVLGLAALLLSALALLPGDVNGQQKKKNQKNPSVPATDQDYYLIQKVKELTGQVLSFDDANHTVSVRINFPEWVPNPKYRNNNGAQHSLTADYNRLMQEQTRAANSGNPVRMQQHYNNMMNFQNRVAMDSARAARGNGVPPFISIDHLKDFDLEMQDKVVYRKMYLPEVYDDTGNLKTLSFEKRAELRGNNNPKGSYAATADEFNPGQGVWIYLTPPKKSSSSYATSSSAKKEKEEDDNPKTVTVPRPTVKMLVIFKKDGTVAQTPNNNPKKKKN